MNAVVPATPTPAPATSQVNKGPAPTGAGAMKTPTPANLPGLFSFMPVTAQKKQKYLKMLIYGLAGGGKTTLAGSAADVHGGEDVLLITAEGGDMVFLNNDRIQHPERITMMRAVRIEQVQKVYEWLSRHVAFRDEKDLVRLKALQNIAFYGKADITKEQALAMDPTDEMKFDYLRQFKTVILDSLTDIEAQNMNHILGVADKGFEVGDDLNPAGYTEFRKNNNTIQQLVRAFRNLDINLIIICGQRWSQDEQKKFHYNPWLTGQLSTQVQSFVDLVGYMIISQTDPSQPAVRRLYVQPQAVLRFDAKCRIANFKSDYFQDPSFADILGQCGFLQLQSQDT